MKPRPHHLSTKFGNADTAPNKSSNEGDVVTRTTMGQRIMTAEREGECSNCVAKTVYGLFMRTPYVQYTLHLSTCLFSSKQRSKRGGNVWSTLHAGQEVKLGPIPRTYGSVDAFGSLSVWRNPFLNLRTSVKSGSSMLIQKACKITRYIQLGRLQFEAFQSGNWDETCTDRKARLSLNPPHCYSQSRKEEEEYKRKAYHLHCMQLVKFLL
jgi:hypothetical protein